MLAGLVGLAGLADRGVRRRIPPGSHLVREGGPGRQFFVIERGRAVVTRGGHKLGTLRPGSYTGEMALLHSTTASATVTAVTPLVVRVFDRGAFEALLESSDDLRLH